jgi:hypothetical protein
MGEREMYLAGIGLGAKRVEYMVPRTIASFPTGVRREGVTLSTK